WLQLDSQAYLSITPNLEVGGVSYLKSLPQVAMPVESMSEWILQQGCSLLGLHRCSDGIDDNVEFELSGGLVLSAYNSPGGSVLDLFRAKPSCEDGTRVMSWPQCAV
ncbi:MAG: hypothetical protein AB8C95_00240, partial [Phycisphaeraceae bacterium]